MMIGKINVLTAPTLRSEFAPKPMPPFTIDRDWSSGIVLVTGRNFWTPEEVDDHFACLREFLRDVRVGDGHVRVLVDLREAGVQSIEVMERISAGARATYRAGDRTAIMVGSSLAKMQMRRTIRSASHEFFVSRDAATTWLLAYI